MLPEPIIESLCRVYFQKKLTWKLRKPVKSDWKLIKRFLWEEKETESIYKLPVQSNPVGSSRSTRCQKSHYKVPYKRTRQLGVMQKRHTSTLGFRSTSISAKASFLSRGAWNGHLRLFRKLAAAKIKHSKIIDGFFYKENISHNRSLPKKSPLIFFKASPDFVQNVPCSRNIQGTPHWMVWIRWVADQNHLFSECGRTA